MRAFRGLILVFALSLLSLVGALLTVTALGGLGDWTRWQFIGFFGLVEAASGLANVYSPNIWRLPVAEAELPARVRVKLAASTFLIPHWGAMARVAAGVVLMIAAAYYEGVAPASLALLPLGLMLAAVVIAASATIARWGVARPDLDVVQIILRMPKRETALPAISLGASALQMMLSIITIPGVKALPPSLLFQPHFAPSASMLAITSVVTVVTIGIAWAVWRDRIAWRAPAPQQREAERFA